ncbi:MAG: NAD(+) diphosphatase [Alphaproteobacteria bacterium]|nr:NAD(+) diphosphatase [Alphaproteobacteria bacterium]
MPVSPVMEPIYTFAGSPIDRAGQYRGDAAWMDARRTDPASRILCLNDLKAPIDLNGSPRLAWRDSGASVPSDALFLGLIEGVAHFAADVTAPDADAGPGCKWIDVRSIAPSIAAGEAAILAQARSMLDWHARHRFCAVCGRPSRVESAGWSRRCGDAGCNAQHFPRTDPVTIMMVVQGDRCLLGRQPRFPPGNYSALAGFVEPGETIEEAVRREVLEEAGLKVGRVLYHASQPWPFPSSLMIGCHAEALSSDIVIDPDELEDARWFSRVEARAMLTRAGTPEAPRLPPPLAIAHQLAKAWIEGRTAL